jgi:hypothetical protein
MRHAVEELLERSGVGIGVDEDERSPGVELQCHEAELGRLDPAFALRARCGDQPSVEAVRPRVVRALEGLAAALPVADDRAPVPADVEERAERVLTVAHEHDRHVTDPRRRERARLGYLARVPDVLP